MIIITGSAVIRPEHLDQALALGIEHSQRSRGEPGCLAHNCHIDAENPQRIVFVEQWVDMAAVKAHFAVSESGVFVRQLGGWSEAAPNMQIFEASEITP